MDEQDVEIAKFWKEYPPPLPKPLEDPALARGNLGPLNKWSAGRLLDAAIAAADGFIYYRWETPPRMPKALAVRAYEALNTATEASFERSELLDGMVAIVAKHLTPALQARMLKQIERGGYLAPKLADALIAEATPATLKKLAAGLAGEQDKKLFARRAQAALALDARALRERLAAMTELPRELAHQLVDLVDYAEDPAWVDVLGRSGAGSELRYAIERSKSADAMVAYLPFASDDDLSDLLDVVPTATVRGLLAYAATTTPARAKLIRARVKKLGVPPAETFGVGTDGGPILLVDAKAAKKWRGAKAGDYERACKAVDDGACGTIDIAGTTAIVLPEQRASFSEGIVMVDGEPAKLKAWKPFASIEFPSGALLLDAAYTVAKAPKGAAATLPLKGRYEVKRSRRGDDHGLRLIQR